MKIESIRPTLKTPFPSENPIWKCPVTGLEVPKTLEENIRYRETVCRKASTDTGLQADLLTACSLSPLYWTNVFAWTYKQFDIDPITGKATPAKLVHHPFITWEIQDDFITTIIESACVGQDLGVKKSRDMGASWCCIDALHWVWLFEHDRQILEMSRTEDYVDKTGNMKALFQRHDYINQWLPEWMLPPDCLPGQKNRTRMHMLNAWNGCCIDGESTTEHAGSGDRRYLVLLDEFAKVKNGKAMRSATGDVTPCRLVNSTPAGAGTEYSRWMNDGTIRVFMLPFWEHPEKGSKRYVHKDPVTGGYSIRSPWFDSECKRRSQTEIDQEILMKDIAAGEVYFDPMKVEAHKALFGRKPVTSFNIDLKSSLADASIPQFLKHRNLKAIQITKGKSGNFGVYVKLVNGRLDQKYTYTLGVDISRGQGASNSTIAVICDQTLEKVAEFASAQYPPAEFARIIIAVALWVGGKHPRKLPMVIYEKNGPGWDVGRLLAAKWGYPFLYKERRLGGRSEPNGKAYGWQNNTNNNNALFGLYARLFEHNTYKEYSIACLDEMKTYIQFPDGKIGPAELVEESNAARLTHGDRVRATGLALWALEKKIRIKTEDVAPPQNSPAYRKQAMKEKDRVRGNKYSVSRPFNLGR